MKRMMYISLKERRRSINRFNRFFHAFPRAGNQLMFALLLFFAFLSGADGQPSPAAALSPSPVPLPTPPPPRVEFEETSHDAGQVWEGEPVSHIYKFKNTGMVTLHISKVRTSCGCTAALASSDTIEPGQTGEIKADFNTRHYRGRQKKTIYVSTDDPANSTVQLSLEVEVKTAATLSPRAVAFRQVSFGEQTSRTIRVASESEPFKITGVQIEPAVFQAKILSEKNEVSKETGPLTIEVTLLPTAPVGNQSGNLIISTDHPKLPQLQASISAQVEGPIQYSPRMLLFLKNDQEQKTVKKVVLTHRGGGEFTLTGAECSSPQFQIELSPIKPNREYELSVGLAPELAPGHYRGLILVKTAQEGQEEIRIPVTANLQK